VNKNIIKQTLALLLVASVIYFGALLFQNYRSSTLTQLESMWSRDLENLEKLKKLPAIWNQIRYVNLIPAQDDKLAVAWAKKIAVPIEINPKGEYQIEVLFISQTEGEHLAAIIQHHITLVKTKNSVWELARTYQIK
jgi:hypothetical protein